MIWFLRNLLALTTLLSPVTGFCTGMTQAKETVDINVPAGHPRLGPLTRQGQQRRGSVMGWSTDKFKS